MKELGIHLPDGTFRSREQIRREAVLKGDYPDPVMETPMPIKRPFSYWSARFKDRQQEYNEANHRKDFAEITFHEPTLLTFFGDLHVGSPAVDYERIEREVEVIVNTPNSYAMLMGDLVDGMFWNPGQFNQMEQTPEQLAYMHSLMEYLGENGKVLVGWSGDHDQWQTKTGNDPYSEFSERTGGYYMHGVGYVQANVGEQTYKIAGAHRAPGFSIYNHAHAPIRLERKARGADIVATAHTHKKAILQQPVHEFGNDSRVITFISIGAYKSTDEYGRKLGLSQLAPEEMYGVSVRLDKDTRQIKPYYDILEAHQDFV